MKKVSVGVIGGAGYTGGELVRLLLNHPAVELSFVQSRSQAGKPLSSVHRDLLGVNIEFTNDETLFTDPAVAVLFLALPHGEAKTFLETHKVSDQVKVIDLSNDFRLEASSTLGQRKFVYGLPELNRKKIEAANSIANPGCFASALQFALLPLAQKKLLGRVSAFGVTGATGAGQKLTETSHFAFRANNLQAYKTLNHQHIGEIEETIHGLQGDQNARIAFVPMRGDFTRGIFMSISIESKLSTAEAFGLFKAFYEGHPFIAVTTEAIDMKSVVNTNKAFIEVIARDGTLVVNTVIDNLLKGASGQAVQNMNLMLGLPETMGLNLKGAGF
jgi:N-acetyl-gamma-glutamyl-phosphate reductase